MKPKETEEKLAQIIEDYLIEEYQVRGTFNPDKAGKELAAMILGAVKRVFIVKEEK